MDMERHQTHTHTHTHTHTYIHTSRRRRPPPPPKETRTPSSSSDLEVVDALLVVERLVQGHLRLVGHAQAVLRHVDDGVVVPG